MGLMDILTIVLMILFFAIVVLAFMYWQMSVKSKREKELKNSTQQNKNIKNKNLRRI